MFINEQTKKWSTILTEELGIKDQNKLNWMSQYATIHEIHEGLQTAGADASHGIYATPLNTIGMGNPAAPMGIGYRDAGIGDTGADFHNPAYAVGSGDALPMSTLPIALNVAAMTIGLELVPVIPAQGPWQMLSYMDFPYAGGKLARFNETSLDGKGAGKENKPIYVKFGGFRGVYDADSDTGTGRAGIKNLVPAGSTVTVKADGKDATGAATVHYLKGKYIGASRIDGNVIVEVLSCGEVEAGDSDTSIADVFDGSTKVVLSYKVSDKETLDFVLRDITVDPSTAAADYHDDVVVPDFVSTMVDHIPGFANFFDGSNDLMSRGQNETGVGNTIGARMFSKLVQMGSVEVTGTVTRQQLQDMPLYGVDVIGKVLEAMQNELSQHINKDILTRLFALGVTNACEVYDAQGANLNLYVSADSAAATHPIPGGIMVGVDGKDHAADFGALKNAHIASAAENITTFQRRIMSRVLAASNLIAQVGRRGRANWIVTNTQVASALQDAAGFVVAPMVNTLTQDGSQSLYFAGSLAGMNVYVDPYMDWSDTRVCVGRKGDGNGPGVIFMPYILADSIQTVAEGTMAPKLLLNSRYNVVDAGFFPEANYFTFYVHSDESFV